MEIPTEALAAAGVAITAVVGGLWVQVRDRIRKMETALAANEAFIRETLVGLIGDATQASADCARVTKRHQRVVDILRKRYGDAVLQETHNAMQQAVAEEADTDRHTKTPQHLQRAGG